MSTKLLNSKQKIVTKASINSTSLNNVILPLLPGEKNKDVDEMKILPDLMRNIFTGDEVSIKDHYASLVAYLILKIKNVSYDQFVGAYESLHMTTELNHSVCSALPYGALITSGIILKWPVEQQNQVVSKMLNICHNDPGLRNVVFHFLIALASSIKLNSSKLGKISVDSPIELYFMLSVDSKREDISTHSVFDSENILNMVDIYLMEPEDCDLCKKISQLLGKLLLSLPEETLSKFWSKLMKSYNNGPTSYKQLAVLQLLSSILGNYNGSVNVEKLFTNTVIKMLSKSSPKIEPYFKSINLSLRNISQKLPCEFKLAIIENILIKCEMYLEKSPVVKLCDTLLLYMSDETISLVATMFKNVIMGEKHKASNKKSKLTNDFNEYEKIQCVRFLGKLINHGSCKYQTKWRKNQLIFLFQIGFLTEFKNLIPSSLAGASRKVFYSCLNQKFSKLTDLDKILKKLVKFAGEHLNKKDENFILPFKDQAYTLWYEAVNVIKSLKESDAEDNIVFKILLRHMMLFMFTDYTFSKETIKELFKVIEYKELHSSEIHWTEVTVDLFLHLLSGNNNAHKNVINCTFSHVCHHMTLKGLDLILSAVKGKDEISDDSGSESDEMDDDNSEGEGTGSEDGASQSDGDENDTSDQETGDNEGQIDKLKDALRQELYKIDTASTCGSIDLDDMNEEEGKQLNSTLGEIFTKQHTKYKLAGKSKVDHIELHFRIRALSLLEIYIESKPSLYSATVILTNLISLLKSSISNYTLEPFTVSVKRCLKTLNGLKEFSNCDSVTKISLCSILNQILNKDCTANVYNDMSEQIVESCLFIIRASCHLDEKSEEMPEYLKIILKKFFETDNHHIPFLLFNSIYSTLTLDTLIDLTLDTVTFAFSSKLKNHKKTQALQLLMTFYNNNRNFKNVQGFENALIKIEENILKESLRAFNQVTEDSKINKKYCCIYLDVLSLLNSKSKNITSTPGPHWNNMPKIIKKLSTLPIFHKELKVSYNKFCNIFNNSCNSKIIPGNEEPSNKKSKRKSSLVNGNEASQVVSTKKKRKKVST